VYNLTRYRYYFFALSLIVIVPGLLALIFWHLNLGIDFTNGTTIDLRFQSIAVTAPAITRVFEQLKTQDVSVYPSTSSSGPKANRYVYITFNRSIGTSEESAVLARLADPKYKLPALTSNKPVCTLYQTGSGSNPTGEMVVLFNSPVTPNQVDAALQNLPNTDSPPATSSCIGGSTGTTATASATATPAAASVGSATATVNGKSVTILTNSSGKTLYYYQPDTATTSACTGSCASAWPPLLSPGGAPTSAGNLPGTLAVISDANGMQVTYNGHPLYTFASDTSAGMTSGDGVNNFHVAVTTLASIGSTSAPTATATAGATATATATPATSSTSAQTFPVAVSKIQIGENDRTFEVNTQTDLVTNDTAKFNAIMAALRHQFGSVYVQDHSSVGPSIASETTFNAILAVAAASLAILLYITFAFRRVGAWSLRLRFGASAIIALLHDAFVVLGLWAIFGHLFNFKVDTLFLTAILTVIGFSVHDTIVVFDRIRENLARRTNETFGMVVDTSLVQTLTRSLNTSLTVLLVLTAEVLFGGDSIHEFVLALLIGIASGTYSSIFNASMILYVWQTGEYRKWLPWLKSAPPQPQRRLQRPVARVRA
jgi:preprotein translocase SecF subunit